MRFLYLILLLSFNLQAQDPCIQNCYSSEIGVREQSGNNDGFDVEKYLSTTGLGRGYAWCAAFVNWAHQSCGYLTPTSSAWSPSWFPDSKLIYEKGKITYGTARYKTPVPGDVFGIYFVNKKRIAHVGFVDDWKEGSFFVTVEGNTNEAGSREGDGVYRKYRLKSQIQSISRWR